MHALVTGGGGFLGRYIVEQLLQRGDQVRVFGRGAYPDLQKKGVDVVSGDLRDHDAVAGACRDVDCVFHTAATAGIHMRKRVFEEVNLLGTSAVIAGCDAHGVERLVYTSSPSAAFAGGDQCGVDEATPLDVDWLERHRCYYSHSKALAEMTVRRSSGVNVARTCALRPHLIFGPRDNHLVPRLIARARSGRLRRIGDGSNLVDVTYVENAATAHLQAADALEDENSPLAGRAYFLSQGTPVNCWQWIDQILALVELPPVRKSLSYRAAWRLGAILEGAYSRLRLQSEPPMTRFLAAQMAKSHWFDISAAQRDFGYRPEVAMSDAMRRLADWLRATA